MRTGKAALGRRGPTRLTRFDAHETKGLVSSAENKSNEGEPGARTYRLSCPGPWANPFRAILADERASPQCGASVRPLGRDVAPAVPAGCLALLERLFGRGCRQVQGDPVHCGRRPPHQHGKIASLPHGGNHIPGSQPTHLDRVRRLFWAGTKPRASSSRAVRDFRYPLRGAGRVAVFAAVVSRVVGRGSRTHRHAMARGHSRSLALPGVRHRFPGPDRRRDGVVGRASEDRCCLPGQAHCLDIRSLPGGGSALCAWASRKWPPRS
jgi:hypothetical protein